MNSALASLAAQLRSAGMGAGDVANVLKIQNERSTEPVPQDTLTLIVRNVFDGETRHYKRVPLDEYLAKTEAFLRRYVAFPSEHEPVAVALWIAHAHFVDAFDVSPILAVTSAEKRSGKTRVLDCVSALVPRPLRQALPSEAVVYSALAERPRFTLLIDEADAIFGGRQAEKYEGLRAVLNSGNRKGTPVLRVQWVNRKRAVETLDVFGAKAIAGIGNLPDTVADRAIPIRMRRKASYEPVARWREREIPAIAEDIGRPANPFEPVSGTDGADGTGVEVGVLPHVDLPDELNDRAQDGWETLFVVAKLAGGDWPKRAYNAALALNTDSDASLTTGTRLLADIRTVFGQATYLPTTELLDGLYNIEDSPWSDWYGRLMTPKALAHMLSAFDIHPRNQRMNGTRVRGYLRADFEDAWVRYLPDSVWTLASAEPDTETETPTSRSVPSVLSVPAGPRGLRGIVLNPGESLPDRSSARSTFLPASTLPGDRVGKLKCTRCGSYGARSAMIRSVSGNLYHRQTCRAVGVA